MSPEDAMGEAQDVLEDEELRTLSFHDIWKEFRRRKVAYRKRYRRNPTGVIVGKLEGGIFAANRHELLRRKLIRMSDGHLFINNMMVIASGQETCIAPFHFEIDQLHEENPYENA